MAAIDEYKNTHKILSFAEIVFDHLLPFFPLTLGDLGEAITGQIDDVPFVVDVEMIDQLGFPGGIGSFGQLVIIGKHADQRRFTDIASADEGIFGPVRRPTGGIIRAADYIKGGMNVHKPVRYIYRRK